ncbi:MAG: Putrescine-binding periplasmic protein precursor [Verrucomicrobia bacterium ADurb.Bin345]|nr:MAG: Putrescine-binding periplasmic protein precursor [Verrucomicrobia bacterium ADurb.Bin345]
MKKLAMGLMGLAALVLLACGCGRGKPVLHLYTWADYIKPELVTRFETENGCRVVIDTFDSNEAMYAKIKAGAGGYDVIVPSSYMVKLMFDQGMLQPIQQNLVPNLVNIDPEYLRIAMDKKMDHSVPYMLTNTGFAYLKSKAGEVEPSWSVFNRTDLAGRMTMLNDMRETIGAALKSLGFSLNTRNERELAAARDVVIGWKKNLAKFENEQYKTGLASGEFILVHGYNGDILQVMEENEDIAFAVPQEGTSISCDDMVIPKSAKNVELAHAFMNFLHDPEIAAENTEYIYFLCPNSSSYRLLSDEIRDDPSIFLPPDVRAKSEMIEDLGEDNVKYTKVWDEIKAAE